MKACSLVVRAFNEEKHIGRLLEGVRNQTVGEVEVILVDSGSTDKTMDIASRFGARVVQIDPSEFTFGRSLNLGLAATAGEVAVIASAHVYPVYPDWLERMLQPFSDSRVVLSYGKQRAAESAPFSEKQIYHRWYPEISNQGQNQPFCNNANAAVRLSTWKSHPYDESLTGLEDLAWAKWAIESGHKIAYVAEAEIIHVHKENISGIYSRYLREAMAFKRIYPEAHFNLYDFIRMTSANTASDLWHSIKQRVFWKCAARILAYRPAQFWGTFNGYRRSSALNWNLRQTFYYPHGRQMPDKSAGRQIHPIEYED